MSKKKIIAVLAAFSLIGCAQGGNNNVNHNCNKCGDKPACDQPCKNSKTAKPKCNMQPKQNDGCCSKPSKPCKQCK